MVTTPLVPPEALFLLPGELELQAAASRLAATATPNMPRRRLLRKVSCPVPCLLVLCFVCVVQGRLGRGLAVPGLSQMRRHGTEPVLRCLNSKCDRADEGRIERECGQNELGRKGYSCGQSPFQAGPQAVP